MARSKIMRIVLVVASALILIGVVLMTWMLVSNENDNVIDVKLKKDQISVIEFENLCLIPGQKYEYTATLKSDRRSECVLLLDFVELEDKTLKNFAYAKIEINGEELCDMLLSEIFESDDLTANVDFSDKKSIELKIVYYLPEEVGNEAQEAEAIFNLNLTTSNELG